ncbi:MAG: tRNA (adenosine(37)-N6)-threonylcarbamoyltransferase complex ATPase subunit type 1 TsaE [Nitritalea sp.]
MKTETISSLEQLPELAQTLIAFAGSERIWVFRGTMGAGKTSTIKAILAKMGVTGSVQSPTFGLVNAYVLPDGDAVYHFDCYRLEGFEEALAIGLDEYLESGAYCFIEWAERIPELLPEHFLLIDLEVLSASERKVQATHI